jgi:hypothetical protein
MRIILALVMGVFLPLAPASALASHGSEFSSLDAIQKFVFDYRSKPDAMRVPAAVQALSHLGTLRDPETSGTYLGFIAGVIGTNPTRAEALIAKMLPISPQDHWIIVRAIAYSGLTDWKDLMGKFAHRLPERKVMIDRYLAGELPTLDQIDLDNPTLFDKLRRSLMLDKLTGKPAAKKVALAPSAELIDTLWGYYFATGAYAPLARIISVLPWSKERNSVDKLTVGNMAKYTLASNAARDPELLSTLKSAAKQQPKEVALILKESIEAAETVETTQLRREAIAAIDELKRKGPGDKRDISFWGQVGQGAIALGCVVGAALGQVYLGIPCVVGGAATSAAVYWGGQP